jgi:hypothetical protein
MLYRTTATASVIGGGLPSPADPTGPRFHAFHRVDVKGFMTSVRQRMLYTEIVCIIEFSGKLNSIVVLKPSQDIWKFIARVRYTYILRYEFLI